MGKVRFGFCLPVFAGASAFDMSLDFNLIRSSLIRCERLGYDSFWVPDHLTMGYGGAIFECWTVLSALAPMTESMRLGTLVLCNTHRHPSLVAKMAATLDVISNGRLEFGFGAGWRGIEQRQYGLPWDEKPLVRVRKMEEALEIIRRMWTEDRPSYEGKYYRIKDAVCEPKPVQKPHPPIWIGGAGEKLTLKAVAKYADGWNVGEVSPEVYARKLEVLKAYCRSLGRDCNTIKKSLETFVLITKKEEELERVVKWSTWLSDLQYEAGEMRPPSAGIEKLKEAYILGSPDECAERFKEYVRVGVKHFMIYFLDIPSMHSAEILAKEIMPSFK